MCDYFTIKLNKFAEYLFPERTILPYTQKHRIFG